MGGSKKFGALLRELRLKAGFGLRKFAEMIGESPSNLSAIETGARSPWQNPIKLKRIANALSLKEFGELWDRFFLSAGRFDGLEDVLGEEWVPAMLRSCKESGMSEAELRKLAEDIRLHKFKENSNAGRGPV
jgi:transcriptional regulator with XRE-family HTH domain